MLQKPAEKGSSSGPRLHCRAGNGLVLSAVGPSRRRDGGGGAGPSGDQWVAGARAQACLKGILGSRGPLRWEGPVAASSPRKEEQNGARYMEPCLLPPSEERLGWPRARCAELGLGWQCPQRTGAALFSACRDTRVWR